MYSSAVAGVAPSDHLINEASIQASLFRTTPIDDELGLTKKYGLRQRLINPAHVQLNPEGESLAWWREMDRTVEEIRYFSRRDAERWIELSNTIAAATAIGLPMMMTSPVRPEWPNVVKALDFGREGETPFLVMEFAEGESLGSRIERDGAIPEDEAIRIISEVADLFYHTLVLLAAKKLTLADVEAELLRLSL